MANPHEGDDRLQTTDSLAGFFSKASISEKTMEQIMRQDSSIHKYDGFRVSSMSRILNQIGLKQRKHNIKYKVNTGEFAIPMELTGMVILGLNFLEEHKPWGRKGKGMEFSLEGHVIQVE